MPHKTNQAAEHKTLLLCGLLSVCLILTACQSTPDTSVIVNKNRDLVEAVQSQQSSHLADDSHKLRNITFPDGHYTYTSQNEKASLTINVDADILRPQADKMAFARVKPMVFTQEMVTGMFNYLFPDEKPYLLNTQRTKGEIEQAILSWKITLSQGTLDGVPLSEDDIATYNEIVSELEKEYETAPEETPEQIVSDGSLQRQETIESGGDYGDNGEWIEKLVAKKTYELRVRLQNASLDVSYYADQENPDAFFWYSKDPSYYFTTNGMVPIGDAFEMPEEKNMKLSYKRAVKKADGFFKAAGLDDVKLFAGYLMNNHETGLGNDNPASQYVYKLFYTRTVNGVPVSCHMSGGSSSDDDYFEPWYYESIEFTISDDGILNIDWKSPCEVTEIINDDIDLIDFDTAMDRFQSTVNYTFGNYVDSIGVSTSIDVHIDSIQLNLVRLREKETAGTFSGLYVPAYVFYGYVKNITAIRENDIPHEGYLTTPHGGWDIYPGPLMVIAINAIDGSTIDTLKDIY